MDYQCPACRKYTPDVARVLSEDRKLRVIYRDTPIFGPRSERAARLAIASQWQGRHSAFHHALMTSKGALDEAALKAAANKAGVDWDRLERDLKARGGEIDRLIERNQALSLAAGISGTPAFVIGETLADGALDYRGLKAEIAEARARMGPRPAPAPPPSEPPVPGDDDRPPATDRPEPAMPEPTPPADGPAAAAARSETGAPARASAVTSSDTPTRDDEKAERLALLLLLGLAGVGVAILWWRRRG